MSVKIADVVLSDAARTYDKKYTYLVPRESEEILKSGHRVKVPFGPRNRRTAYVLGVRDICPQDPSGLNGLKTLDPLQEKEPLLVPDMLALLEWMKNRYICSYGDVIRCMVPGTLSEKTRAKTVRCASLALPREVVLSEISGNRIRMIQQIRLLQLLLDVPFEKVHELTRMAGVSASVLKTLEKKGYINLFPREVIRDPFDHRTIAPTFPQAPTRDQKLVLEAILPCVGSGQAREYLIHGITGSGKTEVYLQLIAKALEKGFSSIVLVPEIALTPQMTERFKARFGPMVAVMHSRLSAGERNDQWKLARDGKVKIVVGARSAVFAPLPDLGLVVIDEEHETSYKSESIPRYHATEIARERCRRRGALLVLGSATPSVETYWNALKGNLLLLKMQQRANSLDLPEVITIDMREEIKDGNKTLFSRCLIKEIQAVKQAKGQTLLFLNRRGYSSFLLCRDCGYTMRCPSCSVSMTYHLKGDRVICHYCGYTVRRPDVCPRCRGLDLHNFGTGTQRIEQEVNDLLPGFTSLRMDADTTAGRDSHEEILRRFREESIDILIGTQMIAKGHDLSGVSLVGVLAADSMLNTGEYLASERTFQLITQVAGRAGRGLVRGRVVLQAYDVDNYCIGMASRQDYESFYNQEIRMRQVLDYPPYCRIACLNIGGTNDRDVYDAAVRVAAWLKSECQTATGNISGSCSNVLGPARAPIAKIKLSYRWRIILKFHDLDRLLPTLTKLEDGKRKVTRNKDIQVSIDIHPLNMY
ncbi:MAG TPA: primosomal protein N' [Clostridiales bacterium]|nr:primosomal protein N' [Clostridiales bacterium]